MVGEVIDGPSSEGSGAGGSSGEETDGEEEWSEEEERALRDGEDPRLKGLRLVDMQGGLRVPINANRYVVLGCGGGGVWRGVVS
jgi:hypothetical protein